MNFDYSEEQALLKDSVERFVRDSYNLESRNALVKAKTGFSAENWKAMADLGWMALPFSEEDGGFGGNQIDTMIVMEEFGKGLVVEPYFASVVLGGGALKRGASGTLKEQLLPGVIDGSVQLALGFAEEQSRYNLQDVGTTATAEGDELVLNGTKSFVLNAATANQMIIVARTSGARTDRHGITLVLVDATADGIALQSYPTVDGLRASEVTLTGVRVPASNVLGKVDDGFDLLQQVANDGILALAAEAVGCMEILYKDTVAYTQQRVQFDHPLSDFQVLQHRMVEMFMEYELARSLLLRATMEAAQDIPEAQRTIHALKHLITRAGTFIGENAVQLHGGMGMTEELRVGHYFKRLLAMEPMFGDGDYHLERFAALEG
jgi:alkylation response protein AidB-like acyl-CoA dehydrogenase